MATLLCGRSTARSSSPASASASWKRRRFQALPIAAAATLLTLSLSSPAAMSDHSADDHSRLDSRLEAVLKQQGFTGRIESTLEPRLGRKLNPQLAHLGN